MFTSISDMAEHEKMARRAHNFRQRRLSCRHHQRSRTSSAHSMILSFLAVSSLAQSATAIHHLQRPAMHLANRQNSDLPLIISSSCAETIYPAILTQSGTGPEKSGFKLDPGDSVDQTVSADWRGRVWGRTNCTFNPDGSVPQSGQGGAACSSGDCGAFMECQGAVSRYHGCYFYII